MKTRALFVGSMLCVLVAGTAMAGDKKAPAQALSNAAPVASANPPQLVIDSMEHEFGTVFAGTPLTYTFKLKNKGKSDLEITDVKPSCGCTKGDYDKVIKPGKTGKITLTIAKTEKYAGKTVKTASVTTNDPEHAAFTLTMRADFVGAKGATAPTQ